MGVVAKQAGWASLAIGTGLVLGALNTMVVLPRAFEGAEADWGLVRIITSWGIILSSLAVVGAPGGIMRFLARYDEQERPDVLRTLLILPASGLLLVLLLFGLNGQQILPLLDAEKGSTLTNHIAGFLLITSFMVLLHLVRALVNQQLKTAIIAWVDEVWQKGSYLVLGVLLYFKHIDFETFITCYMGSWGISALLLFIQAWKLPQRIGKKWRWDEFKNILDFSLFSLFASGAAIIATHLDYVMIGMYVGLAQVPVYTIGFFLGNVVGMPTRATQGILSGLSAALVAQDKTSEINAMNRRSARVNFLLATVLMAGIWAGIAPFQLLLPEGYRGLEFVFLCIGFQRLIVSFNVVNNQVLAYSQWYRVVLPLNLGLVLVTVATNYIFIATMGWGLKGAAAATLGTALWNNIWRLLIVWRKFKIHPFSWNLVVIALIGMASAWSFHWSADAFTYPIVGSVVQGAFASGTTLVLCYASGCFPELRDGMKSRIAWWP